MSALTKGQLERLWVQAGGSPSSANLAASVALAESSGDPQATNNNTNGSTDRGLWQINSVHGSLSTYGELANARAAVAISNNGRDWNPWVTYTTGAYRQFLGATNATPAASSTGGAAASTPTSSASSSSSSGAYGGLGGFLLKAVLTLGLVIAGMVIAGVGARNVVTGTR